MSGAARISPSEPNPVNQHWDGTGADPRRWRQMSDGKSRYTIELLPDWAQGVSHANPILYMVNAFRHGFLGVSDVDVRLALETAENAFSWVSGSVGVLHLTSPNGGSGFDTYSVSRVFPVTAGSTVQRAVSPSRTK